MGRRSEKEELIVQYLLGDLTEEQLRGVEESYFADDDFFEEMAIVEEELIDDYVGGRLAGKRLKQFEQSFLASPARRERVEFARALMKSVSTAQVSRRPADRRPSPSLASILSGPGWQLAAGALALLVVAGMTWLVFDNLRLGKQIENLKTEQATRDHREKELAQQVAEQSRRNDELKARIETERNANQQPVQRLAQVLPQAAPPAVFEMDSSLTRGGGAAKSFTIPAGATAVEIKLYLEPNDYKIFRASLETDGGKKVWSKSGLKAQTISSGRVVTARLPAESFSSGEYFLTLSGATAGGEFEDAGIYSFKVAKK